MTPKADYRSTPRSLLVRKALAPSQSGGLLSTRRASYRSVAARPEQLLRSVVLPRSCSLRKLPAPVPPGYRHRRFPTPRHRRLHQACRCLRQRRQRSRCLAGSNVGTRTKNTWAGGAVLPAGRVRQEAVPWHVRHYFSADRRHTALALRGAASWAGEQSRHALRRPPFGTGSAKALVTANESFNFSAGLTDTASGVKKERWMQERRVYDIGSYAVPSWGLSRLRSVSGRQSAY